MHVEPLTVILPVRNGAQFVGAALSDLLPALDSDDELLVLDDGSQDATPQVLSSWQIRDSRIHVITTTGVGLVRTLNRGFQEARHEWIARADADDRYPRNRLAIQRSALSPGVVLVTGDYRANSLRHSPTYVPCALGHPFVALSLVNPQRIPHPGVLLNRDAVIGAGGYQNEDFPAEDLGLWLRLSAEGTFVGVPQVVVDWTMASGSVSHSHQAEQRKATHNLLAAWRPALLSQVNDGAVSSELARYEKTPYGRERGLLLLRDLRSWHQRGERLSGEGLIVSNLARHPVSTLRAGWRLTREARQRRRTRSQIVTSL